MSWKTSLFGLMAAIGGAVLAGISTGIIDATEMPRWIKGAAGILSVIGSAGVGVFARDNDKTSEDVKAGNAGSVPIRTLLLLFAFFLVGVLMTGCAYVKVYDKERQSGFSSVMPAWPWQDSTAVIERMQISSKSNSFTASVRGLSEGENTSTNMVSLVNGAVGAAVSAAVKSVAPVPK